MASKKLTWLKTRNTEYSIKSTDDPRYSTLSGGNFKDTTIYTPPELSVGAKAIFLFPREKECIDKFGNNLSGKRLITSVVQEKDEIELHDDHANDYHNETMVTYFTTRDGAYLLTDADERGVRTISGPTFQGCEIYPNVLPKEGKPSVISFTDNPNNIDMYANRLSNQRITLAPVQSVKRMTLNDYIDFYNKSVSESAKQQYGADYTNRYDNIYNDIGNLEADLAEIDNGQRAPEVVESMMQMRGYENFNFSDYIKSQQNGGMTY